MPRPSSQSISCWFDGRLVPAAPHAAEVASRDALAENRACYSTALIRRGRPVWLHHHTARTRRDALALGLGEIAEDRIAKAFCDLARAAFGEGDGIVRVLVYSAPEGAPRVLAEARDIGSDPDDWSAVIAPFPHVTSTVWTGAKGSNFTLYERARELMAANSLDEVMLLDREDFAIEGCRSNVFIVDRDGTLIAPNISRGAVAGLAQQLVHDRVPELVVRDFHRDELPDALEIIAVNSVRHARPIVRLDDRAVGDGSAGPWSERLLEILSSEP